MTPKELRKELGLTVQEMAMALGYSPTMVSMIENEIRNPSIAKLKKYEELSNGRITSASFKTIQ